MNAAITSEAASAFIAYSNEHDLQLAARLAAWHDGYATAATQFKDWEQRGYARAVADMKAAQHGFVRDVRAHLAMWDGPRERFGDPRPGDYQGGPVKPW